MESTKQNRPAVAGRVARCVYAKARPCLSTLYHRKYSKNTVFGTLLAKQTVNYFRIAAPEPRFGPESAVSNRIPGQGPCPPNLERDVRVRTRPRNRAPPPVFTVSAALPAIVRPQLSHCRHRATTLVGYNFVVGGMVASSLSFEISRPGRDRCKCGPILRLYQQRRRRCNRPGNSQANRLGRAK